MRNKNHDYEIVEQNKKMLNHKDEVKIIFYVIVFRLKILDKHTCESKIFGTLKADKR